MTTINPAKASGDEGRCGTLRPLVSADITGMELLEGDYLSGDWTGFESMRGKILIEPRMVFKRGEAMPAYSRYHIPPLFT
jgi:hypothetical protein